MVQVFNSIGQIIDHDSGNRLVHFYKFLRWQFIKVRKQYPKSIKISESYLVDYQPTGVAALAYFLDMYDFNNMNLLRRIFSTLNLTFIDIGANIGSYSLVVSEMSVKVYAFEPHPVTFTMLANNIKANKRDTVYAVQKAAHKKKGIMQFTNFSDNALNKIKEDGDLIVNTIDLDSFIVDEKIDNSIIKIDVEGDEESVLDGLQNSFDSIKLALIENGDRPEIKDILLQKNFLGPFYYHEKYQMINGERQRRSEDQVYIQSSFISSLKKLGIRFHLGPEIQPSKNLRD